jgi:hypothetical protein
MADVVVAGCKVMPSLLDLCMVESEWRKGDFTQKTPRLHAGEPEFLDYLADDSIATQD